MGVRYQYQIHLVRRNASGTTVASPQTTPQVRIVTKNTIDAFISSLPGEVTDDALASKRFV